MNTSEMKQRLLAQRAALQAVEESGNEAARPVALDQTRVGRLSRMDAMAQQAVASATSVRRRTQLRQIEAALTRIAQDRFGFCANCDEPIGEARLAANPSVISCIACAERAEAR